MPEIPNRDPEEIQQPQPQILFDPNETKVVHEVPVEQLIPNIKPASEIKQSENVDYNTNRFDDSFIYDFLNQEMATIVQSKEYEGAFAEGKEELDILRDRIKNQIVVDLGSDKSWQGYCLASLLGAKGYIGVDAFTKGNLEGITEEALKKSLIKRFSETEKSSGEPDTIEGKINNHIKPEAIPASIIQGDMLDFLKRLPDNSVSIFTFGISTEIIRPSYKTELGKEISRVLDPNGGELTFQSNIPVDGIKNLFKELFDEQFKQPDDNGDKYFISPWLISGNPGFFVKEENKDKLE